MLGGHKESTAINLINKTVRFWSVNIMEQKCFMSRMQFTDFCLYKRSALQLVCSMMTWNTFKSFAWRPNQPNGLHAPSCIWWFVPWQSLAGWFGFEHTRLLPEWIDTLAGISSSLLLLKLFVLLGLWATSSENPLSVVCNSEPYTFRRIWQRNQ